MTATNPLPLRLDEIPDSIDTEDALDELLTRPGPALIELARTLSSPLVVLGAGGKMGPTLSVLALRAAEAAGRRLEVVAVSRFGDPAARRWLDSRGVTTLALDLLDPSSSGRLPESANVVYLAGRKFGTAADPALTWAVNTLVPSRVAERYRGARIAALSSGNVYAPAAAAGGGSVETDARRPVGEYGWACVARERVFEHHSRRDGTPVVLVRLNYAVELRYGVFVDIAAKLARDEPVDVSTGFLNAIWQRDANESVLRLLALAEIPARAVNLTGPRAFSVRALAETLGRLMGRVPRFAGVEGETALLANASLAAAVLGPPPTPHDRVLVWTARWVGSARRLLGKPTHFEVRDGSF